jgi:F-type H+-transporting ATPase subunit delta
MAGEALSITRISAVAETYAGALFDLAQQAQAAQVVRDDLERVARVVAEHPELSALLKHRTIDLSRRAATINNVFAADVHSLTLRFLLILNRRQRMAELPGIAHAFDQMLKAHRGQVDVQVTTARALPADQIDSIAAQLSTAIGSQAIVHTHIDPALIGGIKIRIGDRVIDASVARQLQTLARKLTDKSHEVARLGAQLRA